MTSKTSYVPGLIAAVVCAAIAIALEAMLALPAIIAALFVGLALQRFVSDPRYDRGLDLVAKRVLRIGVALLGVRITFADMSALGAGPIVMVLLLSTATILLSIGLCRVLELRLQLGFLTGGAVAICGASAAIALSSILKQDKSVERDTMFTIVAVTALSTIAMVIYPLLFSWLGLSDSQSGIMVGATIHDVAQVVGAGYAISESAGDTATYVKLLRVSMLPAVLVLALAAIRLHNGKVRKDAAGGHFPVFVIAFGLLVVANSIGLIPREVANLLSTGAQLLLVSALAALGLKTSLGSFRSVGALYLVLIVLETVFLLGFGIVAIGYFTPAPL